MIPKPVQAVLPDAIQEIVDIVSVIGGIALQTGSKLTAQAGSATHEADGQEYKMTERIMLLNALRLNMD